MTWINTKDAKEAYEKAISQTKYPIYVSSDDFIERVKFVDEKRVQEDVDIPLDYFLSIANDVLDLHTYNLFLHELDILTECFDDGA